MIRVTHSLGYFLYPFQLRVKWRLICSWAQSFSLLFICTLSSSPFLPPSRLHTRSPSQASPLSSISSPKTEGKTGRQALGDGAMAVLMGDGGEGVKNSVPRMSTPTHVHNDLYTWTRTHTHTLERQLCNHLTHWHTHQQSHTSAASLSTQNPLRRPLCGLIGVIIFA